jgi:hypothetical protein
MLPAPRYVPLDVRCHRCRQAPGSRCREVVHNVRQWWDDRGQRIDPPRIVEVIVGAELRHPHPERVRYAREESARYLDRQRGPRQ